jgi:transformation/transcription domain-associated protein
MPLLKPYQDQIADGVLLLMKDCPEDASVTRKELLVAARHLWYTDFRSSFLKHIDLLLNDDVLVGTGVTSRETLRSLARSVMIDLLHNLRMQLNTSQIRKVIALFSQDLQDPSISPTTQTMCVKVMLGLADSLQLQANKTEARSLLVQILDCFSLRLARLGEILVIVKETAGNQSIEENYIDMIQMNSFIDYGFVQPIRTSPRPLEPYPGLQKDVRFQFKSVLIGIKTILGSIRTIDSQEVDKTHAQVHFAEEAAIFSRVFRDGLEGLEHYFPEESRDKVALQKDEKEVVEAFAGIFTTVEPAMFQESCCTQIEFLFDKANKTQFILAVPQFFLGNSGMSANFSGPLLHYLLQHFDDVGGEDTGKSGIMLRFFKLLFMALSLFPEQNEPVFRPHLADMIMRSLKVSSKAKEPLNYFLLLRGLFRSIGGGKFENLYNEVLPLLQVLLETLNALLLSAHKPQMRELFVELCLTVPVRLSVLLPHLSYLMRPLVIALRAGPELVSQSLKTLELCIDNLNQEFLEPIFAPVKEELMDALWTHLQPAPYNQQHSHTTMRILGKFGGRNRRILRDQSPLEFKKSIESAMDISVNLAGSVMFQTLPLEDALAFCKKQLFNPISNPTQQKQCYTFLKSTASMFFDVQYEKDVFEQSIMGLVDQFRKSFPKKESIDSADMEVDEKGPFSTTPDLSRPRREALETSILEWFSALMAAATIAPLEEEAWALVQGVCRHFALLSLEESVSYPKLESKAIRQPSELLTHYSGSRLNGFLRAIVEVICDDRQVFRQMAERVVTFFHETCAGLVGNNALPEKVIAFDILGLWFASQCYQPEWFKKAGGCHGLSVLSSKLGFGIGWMLDQELEFTKALLYVLKDSPVDMPYFDATISHDTLMHILRFCNDSNATKLPNYSSKFNSLVSLLISELYNANKLVRNAVQKSLELLAELGGQTVTDILLPVKDRLLYPIFAKPLRALPFAMQIGYIEAMTYCLNLRPTLVEFSDELGRLLHEALALGDAEDQTLTGKDNQYKNAIALNNLKVECIKLLSAVMNLPEIATPRLASTRSRIITLFFKSLYSKSPEVIEVANSGLTEVVQQQQRLPKDLLQAGLKPILVNLSDYKKLTVAGLQGLARLLQLLTNYFKVEIGKKLLDHLRHWAEPAVMADLNGKPLNDSDTIAVIAAVLDVFYLLPPAANVFMDELVTQVLELETMVHRTHSSPFRPPLIRFLNRYSEEAVDYFLERFESAKHVYLFLSLLQTDLGTALQEELFKRSEQIIEKFTSLNDYGDKGQCILRKHGLWLFETMVGLDHSFLIGNPALIQYGIDIWKRTPSFDIPSYDNHLQLYCILKLVIKFCEQTPDRLDLIFVLVDALMDQNLMDQNFIKQFLFTYMKSLTLKQAKGLLERFFDNFQSDSYSLKQKASVMRNLLIPMLYLRSKGEFSRIIDETVVSRIVNLMWTPVYTDITVGERDALNLEIIQLTTLILYQNPDATGDFHKEAVKFAWAHLKLEDILVRQASYVLLCKFIREFETPAKIVTQTYVAQLRAHQAEIRPMVRQALDNLVPALPSRQGMSSKESGKVPIWVQWIRKIIVEDGHSVSQLVSLYQLLIRNADHLYEHRFHFIPQIIPSLARLGLSANATTETKSISLDLTVLLSKWEKKAMEEARAHGAMDIDESSSDSPSHTAHQEKLFTFLIRFCLSLTDPVVQKSLSPIALSTFREFLSIWPHTSFAMVQLEKVAAMDLSENTLIIILNLSDLLKAMVETRSNQWILENLGLIQKCLEKWATAFENESLLDSFSAILTRTIEACTDGTIVHSQNTVQSIQNFYKSIDARLHDRLKQMNNVPIISCLLKVGYMTRLQVSTASNLIRSHLNELMNLLQHLVNEMLSNAGTNPSAPSDLPSVPSVHIETLITVLNSQMLYLGELRKQFLQILGQIVDSKEARHLHPVILDLLRRWTIQSTGEAFPTVKEQSTLAVKMVILENHGNLALFEEYMNLVADIYEEDSLSRTEMTVRLEHVFLAGMRMVNAEIRNRYAVILDKSIPESVQSRIRYILGIQNWQSLSNTFWVAIALDLLLGSVVSNIEAYNCNTGRRYSFIKQRTCTMRSTKFLNEFIRKEMDFVDLVRGTTLDSLVQAVRSFVYDDPALSYTLWTRIFPLCWNVLSSVERHDAIKNMIALLAKEYHSAQINLRPNVVQALLEGLTRCHPHVQIPPQLIKYLGRTYNAWHIAIELLQGSLLDLPQSLSSSTKDEEKIRESYLDALADIFTELNEEDYFAGLWRKRCLFPETNAAISYEQCGMWQTAQKFYESAQGKARTCVLPFTESEYVLWEQEWIGSTQRLQQWDILCDLAKHESDPELLLECAWRLSDWSADKDSLTTTLQSITQPATPRKKLFQAFLVLNRLGDGQDSAVEFQRICDEGIQLVLRKWRSLPEIVSNSHIPTFHAFQEFVELHEAYQIQTNLGNTNASNIDTKAQELKNTLSTWRDRLPNTWDDMNLWSDLVAWRQHVFTSINKAYLPLIPQIAPMTGSNPSSSFAYRGYHETAWIINRFAHVARKHRLPEVCISSLGKIYTLPNIEIQEAFFKLREQAKCHKDVLGEYSAGLDVINNTNLLYFNPTQKAEFFNLRGVFLSKLNLHEEATQAFSSAIQVEPSLPHGWASYGEYCDRLFDENPAEIKHASDALNCYLNAAAIHNSGKSRRYLSRILWLISLDDDQGTLMKVCENAKPEPPLWYWITFIPELIGALSGRESKFAKSILVRIAKTFPQALHFQLRTAKEDFASAKRQMQNQSNQQQSQSEASEVKEASDQQMEKEESKEVGDGESSQPSTPWDHVEEVMSILKTAFPLLALTLESMVDQIIARLKPTTDEDIYRLIIALLNDGIHVCICLFRCIFPIYPNIHKMEDLYPRRRKQA